MNIVFDYNKNMNEYSEFLESDYKLEYLNIDDKTLEAQDNFVSQINELKLPSDDMESVHDEQVFEFNNLSKKSLEEEDLFVTPKFRSACLANDTHFNFMDAKHFEFGNELFVGKVNPKVGNIEEKYSDKPEFDHSANFELSKNVQEPQASTKHLYLDKSQSYVDPEKHGHHNIEDTTIKIKQKDSDFIRWGRDDDVLVFKALREL